MAGLLEALTAWPEGGPSNQPMTTGDNIWSPIPAMKANLAKHPLYSGVGQNVGENILYDRVDPITGQQKAPSEQSFLSDRIADVSGLTGREDSLLQDAPIASADDSQPVIELKKTNPPPDPVTDATTVADLKGIQENQIENEAIQKHNEALIQGAIGIQQAGGTEEDVKGWQKFSEDYNLGVVGMALMASSDNGGSLAANLGRALMMGRQAATTTREKAAASAAAGRKEGRAISKLVSENTRRDSQNRTDAGRVEAAMLAASASMKRAKAAGATDLGIVDNAAAIEATGLWLESQGVNSDAALAKAQEFATDVAALHARGGWSMAEAQRQMYDTYKAEGAFSPTGFFTTGDFE